jgi:aminoglycoside phosphotransferase family enzyme/predicted kinase
MNAATTNSIEPSEVIRGLLRPDAYTHAVDSIELKETHGAWVLLAGPYAYKLKKPVNYGFFDYSTRERRDADAEAEARLNRRLAPSTYLGLVDVVERDGRIYVGGDGRVLERAVWMRRLPQEGMLAELLAHGAASSQFLRRIADMVAEFHRRVPTGPGVDEFGKRSNLEANWRENFAQVAPYVGVSLSSPQLEAIRRYVEVVLRDGVALLDRRVAEGRIRDGHGDLHAGSICLVGGEIVIFDCIQFSARYRCADVAAEVAFLAMDLDHVGRADLSWAFVDEYVRRSGDEELPQLLGFYKCYRAFVRGKVLSLRLGQGHLSNDERQELTRQARAYFDLAAVYAAGSPRPYVLVVSGLPASGKTTLAHELASRLGLVSLSTDIFRKRRAGMRPTDRGTATFEAGLYEADITRSTYAALRREAAKWLRRGVSVVLDGTFGAPRERELARRLALRNGAGFLVVVTQCDESTARRRIEDRQTDPANVSDATWDVYQRMRRAYVAPSELSADEMLVDESGGSDAEAVCARVVNLLHQSSGLIPPGP